MTKSDKTNPFKLIKKVDELPPELKKEVMATINFTHLATDVARLFTVDMGKTASKMIEITSEEEQ